MLLILRICYDFCKRSILCSIKKPHQASNKKQEIFGSYYDELFIDDFQIENSDKYIKQFFSIEKEYLSYSKKHSVKNSDQKYFYIIYIMNNYPKFENNISLSIEVLEQLLQDFVEISDIPDTRKLIQLRFKQFLDEEIKNEILFESQK